MGLFSQKPLIGAWEYATKGYTTLGKADQAQAGTIASQMARTGWVLMTTASTRDPFTATTTYTLTFRRFN